jgi:hypothetical protein
VKYKYCKFFFFFCYLFYFFFYFFTEIENIKITKTVLPILEGINPGRHVNQELITKKFADESNKSGRFWFQMNMDGGALDIPYTIHDGHTNILINVATGHLEMCITKVMMELVIAVCGRAFMYAHGFLKSGGGPAHLEGCSNNHLSYDYNVLVSEALYREVGKQFLKKQLKENNGDYSPDAMIIFLDDSTRQDATFNNVVSYLKIFDAYCLLRRGIRDGNYFAYNAARKIFHPFFFMLNHDKYARLSLWDQFNIDFRVTQRVRYYLHTYLSFWGEGPDFAMEEIIKEIKQGATKNGLKGLIASGTYIFFMCMKIMIIHKERTEDFE